MQTVNIEVVIACELATKLQMRAGDKKTCGSATYGTRKIFPTASAHRNIPSHERSLPVLARPEREGGNYTHPREAFALRRQ